MTHGTSTTRSRLGRMVTHVMGLTLWVAALDRDIWTLRGIIKGSFWPSMLLRGYRELPETASAAGACLVQAVVVVAALVLIDDNSENRSRRFLYAALWATGAGILASAPTRSFRGETWQPVHFAICAYPLIAAHLFDWRARAERTWVGLSTPDAYIVGVRTAVVWIARATAERLDVVVVAFAYWGFVRILERPSLIFWVGMGAVTLAPGTFMKRAGTTIALLALDRAVRVLENVGRDDGGFRAGIPDRGALLFLKTWDMCNTQLVWGASIAIIAYGLGWMVRRWSHGSTLAEKPL